mgnify:CR=1 FL=1
MINEMQGMQNSGLGLFCVFLAYLIAMLFAFIILPPEYKRTFYKQEIFHRTAITYFIIFIAISLIFGVFI